ncbi:MAG: TonB family protein [Opitutaceae bacterium]
MKPIEEELGGLATLEKPKLQQPVVHEDWGDEDEKPTGFKKWRAPLIVAVLTCTGITYAVKVLSKADGGGSRRDNTAMVQIQLPPAPPPPPPPPPPPEQMKEEMIKQEEEKEEEPDTTPPDTTAIKGPPGGGPSLAAARPGNFFAKRSDGGKTKWGWYAGQVQTRIGDLLRNNPRTKKANIQSIDVRIWADSGTGRIQKASLVSSTGDTALDAAIIDALQGAQLQQPPPEGMPMPIVLRVTARRPN